MQVQYRDQYAERQAGTIPWCSAVLAGMNVIAFAACHIWGEWMYKNGSFSVIHLIRGGEYYRLITSMFLHADISHLVNNMLILYFGGEMVEKTVGKVRYLLVFFLSGICGNLLSAVYELLTGAYYESIGASGAVFGLIGGLLYLVIAGKGKGAGISVRRMLLMIALSFYSGIQSVRVNNAAHLGGILAGFLLTFLLCHIGRMGTADSE